MLGLNILGTISKRPVIKPRFTHITRLPGCLCGIKLTWIINLTRPMFHDGGL